MENGVRRRRYGEVISSAYAHTTEEHNFESYAQQPESCKGRRSPRERATINERGDTEHYSEKRAESRNTSEHLKLFFNHAQKSLMAMLTFNVVLRAVAY